jgi:hypothetical protein
MGKFPNPGHKLLAIFAEGQALPLKDKANFELARPVH